MNDYCDTCDALKDTAKYTAAFLSFLGLVFALAFGISAKLATEDLRKRVEKLEAEGTVMVIIPPEDLRLGSDQPPFEIDPEVR